MSNIEVSQLVEHLGSVRSSLPISNPITGNVIYELPQLSAEQVGQVEAFISNWKGQGEVSLPAGVKVSRISGRLTLSK